MTNAHAVSDNAVCWIVALLAAGVLAASGCSYDTTEQSGSGSSGGSGSGGEVEDGGATGGSDGASDIREDGGSPDVSRPSGDPADNPQCVDEDGDGYYGQCPEGSDCHDGDAEIHPGAEETCEDKVDNDCSGGRDNGCSCDEAGATRPCYPGPAGTAGQGGCRTGDQTCENGVWSRCEGHTLPETEVCDGEDDDCDGDVDEEVGNACGLCGEVTAEEECGNGLDDNCDGRVDEGCQCGPNETCYTGPPHTLDQGACEAGTRECSGETWGRCEGDTTPTSETCGDGVDNDCDGETDEGCDCEESSEVCDGIDNDCDGDVDEGCTPCLDDEGGKQPWQIHRGDGPTCWPKKFDKHGAREEYEFADIPPKDDSGWKPEPDNFISFDERSNMCGDSGEEDKCECRKGGDFTYFQTFFDIPPSLDVESLQITIENVDDGARITIYNDDHPNGVVDEGSYAFINDGASSTTDLAEYLTSGTNRIVITHVDDCCRTRRIEGVHVTLNDEEITKCSDQ